MDQQAHNEEAARLLRAMFELTHKPLHAWPICLSADGRVYCRGNHVDIFALKDWLKADAT